MFLFTDIDECAVNNGHCEHNCTNEAGGYSCRCASGYQLDQDGHNCTGKTQLEGVVIPSVYPEPCHTYRGFRDMEQVEQH